MTRSELLRARRYKHDEIARAMSQDRTTQLYTDYVHDCGELGILTIRFHHGWSYHVRWQDKVEDQAE